MNRIFILFLLGLSSWVTATLLPAQPASTRKSIPSRFLLVVDTSFSMAPQKAVLCTTAHDLIYSGIRNQMKPGDTFSVWTFNQDTDTQQFPLLEWNPDLRVILARQVAAFLNNQPFQKISRLDKALPEILGLTKDSRKLTVFILSDGLEFFQGTPFDVRINEVYRERSRELRQAGKPFITLLQAMDGQIVGWSVSAAGEAIQISQLPASTPSTAPVVSSEPTPDRLGSASGASNSGPAQPGSVKAPDAGVGRPNLIIRSVRPTDQASKSSSPATDEKAGAFAGLSEKTKLQLRVPPQSVEPDSSRLNLALAPPIAFTQPANLSEPLHPNARPIEAPSATSALASTTPGPAQSVTPIPENGTPAIPEATATLTATPLETSLIKPESFKPAPELVSAAIAPSPVTAPTTPRAEKTGEHKIAAPAEIQAAVTTPPPTTESPKNTPAEPNLTATRGPQTFAKPQPTKVETPPAGAVLAAAQASPSNLGKTEREPAAEKPIPATPHPLPNVPSAANGKAQEQLLPSSNSPTGAQVAVLAPRFSYQFRWGYFALGMTSILTALALIYILTRRTRAPRRSSLISRSIERK